MTATARVRAQAKVNLFLHVLAREVSGFHSIETLFCRIDLADDVMVTVGGSGRSLDCAGPAMPPGGLGDVEANLAWRAAALYASETGWPSGFAMEIVKRIPVGGGLGGGSADAAAVLRALDRLSPSPLGNRLRTLASRLGADVTFLTTEAPLALGWGRGDRLLHLPPLPVRRVEIAAARTPISTADAYRWVDELDNRPADAARSYTTADLGNWESIARLAANDFEPAVFPRHPEIAAARRAFADRGAIVSLLAGSGGSVFGVFDGARAESGGGDLLHTEIVTTVAPVGIDG